MKYFQSCGKLAAGVCALAFIMSTMMALLLFNARIKLFDSDIYKTALQEQEVYRQLPTLVARQIATSITYDPCAENPVQCENDPETQVSENDEGDGPPAFLKNLSQEQWEQILTNFLTPAWTQTQVESALDQFFNFVHSDEETLSLTISLEEVKSNLAGQNGVDIVIELVNSQPPCTEQLLDLLFSIASGDFTPDELLLCAPPEEIMEALRPEIEVVIITVMQGIPDQINFEREVFQLDANDESPSNPRAAFQMILLFMLISPILPVICLALVTMFGARSLKALLLWWGVPLTLVGTCALSMVLLGSPMIKWGWDAFVLERIPALVDPALVDIGLETLLLVLKTVFRSIAIQAGIFTFVGIIMSVVGILWKSAINPFASVSASR